MLLSDAVVPVLAGPLRGSRWIIGSGIHSCWLGRYELAKVRRFASAVREGCVVYDIGAAVGFYTVLAAKRVGPIGEVLAFEPLSRNLTYLHLHLALNHLKNVTVVDAAVAEMNGTARFLVHSGPFQGRLDEKGGLDVRMVSLDTFVDSEARRPPDVMKIDVEGAELRVLRGARRTLRTHRPVIFLATHSATNQKRCRALLDELGYAIEPLDAEDVEQARELIATPVRAA